MSRATISAVVEEAIALQSTPVAKEAKEPYSSYRFVATVGTSIRLGERN
jgi:hypothetical protein